MRFYRPLGHISAITFDLDDTLYDNRPVILRTEPGALAFLQNYHPALRTLQNADLQRLRQALHITGRLWASVRTGAQYKFEIVAEAGQFRLRVAVGDRH